MAHVSPKGGPEFFEGCDLYCISLSQGGERRDPGDYAYGGPEEKGFMQSNLQMVFCY